MILDIIVPHYKEPWSVCKYLFDSIALQRGIDFNDIRVLLINDGDEILCGGIENALYTLSKYPFTVDYIVKEHGGVSSTRNCGLRESDAEYVMFCDCDDGFLNNYGIYTIFTALKDNPDYVISNFIEEVLSKENGKWEIVRHEMDLTFMHGKVYKRSFLMDNELFFDERMTLHEDGYFNLLADCIAEHNGVVRRITTPIYIWKWNGQSTVRQDSKDFVLRTYEQLMLTRIGLCEQLKRRGYEEDFRTAVCMTVMNSYYDFQKPSYGFARNAKHRTVAEKAFRKFWMQFKNTFCDLTNEKVADVAKVARDIAYKNGMLFEQQDLKSFLKHIEYEVK